MNKPIHSAALCAAILASLAFTHVASATTYYIDPVAGIDTNNGTSLTTPIKTIARGGVLAGPGDTVNLRGGIYSNQAAAGHDCIFDNTYSGTGPLSTQVVTVQAYQPPSGPMEKPIFDPGFPEFMHGSVGSPNTAWVVGTTVDPNAIAGEYISALAYPETGTNTGGFGCFLNSDLTAGDRLLSYSNIEDLRATNESSIIVPLSDPRPGQPLLAEVPLGSGNWVVQSTKWVWTYRGPGVWWNPTTHKFHFRAAPTHYGQTGVVDYSGGSDPRTMVLSISRYQDEALNVFQADYLTLKNIIFQNGGNRTAEVGGNSTGTPPVYNYAEHVTFDHCSFFSSRNGTANSLTKFLTFQHCVFDGKLPSYACRSDIKDSFDYVDINGVHQQDGLCRMTMSALLCAGVNQDKEISHCEFRNGHDGIQLTAPALPDIGGETRPRLHDSLIENCNDEAVMFYGAYPCVDVQVYNNVIRSCMQAFSSSVGVTVGHSAQPGARYVYRNIIDMRVPSLGFRQMAPDPVLFWRYGEDLKCNDLIPELYCYQNTFVLGDMNVSNSTEIWSNVVDWAQCPRKFMNNIDMIVQTDKPLYDIPKNIYSGNPYLSDGNLWCRRKAVLDTKVFGGLYTGTAYNTWTDFRNSALWTSYYTSNGVGWETHPIASTPMAYAQFANVGDYVQGYGRSWPNTDYRLKSNSPAIGAGVDLSATGWFGTSGSPTHPDIGALPYSVSAPVLTVGVDSRIHFPDGVRPLAEAGDYSVISDAAQQGSVTVAFDSTGSSTPTGSLTYNWILDGQSIGTTASFSKDLPFGNHQVFLSVSNGTNTDLDLRDIEVTDPSTAENVVRNSGFEVGSTNWSLGSGCSVVSSPTHYLLGSLQAIGGTSIVSSTQLIPAVANASTKVSGWIQTSSVPAGKTAHLELSWLNGGTPVGSTTNIGGVTGNTSWTYVTGTASAPSTATTAQVALVVDAGSTGGTAYFDDIRLLIVDNKINKGSFEVDNSTWVVTQGAPVVTTDPTLSHSGNGAVQMTGTAGYYLQTQDIPVTVGQTYYLEGWVKTVNMPSGLFAKITGDWLTSTHTGAGNFWTATVGDTVGAYTKVSFTTVPVPTGKAYIRVGLKTDSGCAPGVIYFDDIYVK